MAYAGCFKVVGPSAADLAKQGKSNVLPDLFYQGDPQTIASAIDGFKSLDGARAEVILISREMTDPRTGLVVADGHLLPMSEESWSAYQRLPGWSVVSSSPEVAVLQRNAADAGPP
jgi:hypothetical protein